MEEDDDIPAEAKEAIKLIQQEQAERRLVLTSDWNRKSKDSRYAKTENAQTKHTKCVLQKMEEGHLRKVAAGEAKPSPSLQWDP